MNRLRNNVDAIAVLLLHLEGLAVTFRGPERKTVEFANSIGPDEMAHDGLPNWDLL